MLKELSASAKIHRHSTTIAKKLSPVSLFFWQSPEKLH